jgi:hypothetical protein
LKPKSKESFKLGDGALDICEDVRNRRQELRSLHGRISLAKLYVSSEVVVHVHVRTAGPLVEGELSDFCATFKASPRVDAEVVEDESPHVTEAEPLEMQDGTDCLNDPVFVGVVNVVESPQGMRFRLIPSTIRLQPLDECFLTRREVLNECASVVPILITNRENREGRFVVGRAGLEECQLPNELVEGRTQVVGDFPDDDAPLLGRGSVNLSPQDALVCLSIVVREDSVGFSLKEPLNLLLKGFEVHTRPTNLEPGTV